jgi:hypothetical protein
MKTLTIQEFREDADELEFWIPCDFTFKMIEHLRGKDIGVQIMLNPVKGNMRAFDQDVFSLAPVGKNKRRSKIIESVNGFCEKNRLATPIWPDNF